MRDSRCRHTVQASFEETNDILFRAATYAERDIMAGVSENILMGQMCPVGTGAFSLLIDEEKLQGRWQRGAGRGGRLGGRLQGRGQRGAGRAGALGEGGGRAGATACTWAGPPPLPCPAHHPLLRSLHYPRSSLQPPTCVAADAIELDYALVEDAGWGPGVGMTPGRMTPGRSPSHHLRASPSQLASPAGMSPFNDAVMFSPLGGDGVMFSPGPATSPGYRCGRGRRRQEGRLHRGSGRQRRGVQQQRRAAPPDLPRASDPAC